VPGVARFRFTEWHLPSGGGTHIFLASNPAFGELSLRDCQLYGGSLTLAGASTPVVNWHNNLLVRSFVTPFNSVLLTFYHNLFKDGSINWQFHNGPKTICDNSFDNMNMQDLTDGASVHHNAYINFAHTSTTNNVVISNFTYQAGPLGAYYHDLNLTRQP
jgi:hypothetical protein